MKKIFVKSTEELSEWVETDFLDLRVNDLVIVEGETPAFKILCNPFTASDGKTVVYFSQVGGDK